MMYVEPIPKAPPFLEGVIDLRGVMVPVVDLRKYFGGVRDAYTFSNRIIVILCADKKIGFIVDRIDEVCRPDQNSRHEGRTSDVHARFFEGMVEMRGGRLVQMTALDRILLPQEIEAVVSFK